MWTTENTEGFNAAELSMINAIVDRIWADAPESADESYLSAVNDAVNNAWVDGNSESELERRARADLAFAAI